MTNRKGGTLLEPDRLEPPWAFSCWKLIPTRASPLDMRPNQLLANCLAERQ